MSASDCPTLLSKQAGIGHPILYSGSRFTGEQKNLNKATSYEVEVILQVIVRKSVCVCMYVCLYVLFYLNLILTLLINTMILL